VKLGSPRYIYEAELVNGNRVAEIEVSPEGQVIEAPEWRKGVQKKTEMRLIHHLSEFNHPVEPGSVPPTMKESALMVNPSRFE